MVFGRCHLLDMLVFLKYTSQLILLQAAMSCRRFILYVMLGQSMLKSEAETCRPLPRSFLGDRTTSYNGFIRFKIHNDDNRRGINGVLPDAAYFRYFAQVILVSS